MPLLRDEGTNDQGTTTQRTKMTQTTKGQKLVLLSLVKKPFAGA